MAILPESPTATDLDVPIEIPLMFDIPNELGRWTQPKPSNDVAILPSWPAAAYTPFPPKETARISELPNDEGVCAQVSPLADIASFPPAPNAINLSFADATP